jgi:UDP-N-acetylmuramoyl-tripeptide--D-alanyl-D-alanine ligase
VADLVECTGGTLLRGDLAARATTFAIDTRRLEAGGAFFALRGSQTDGHNYLGEAGRLGAAVAVVERDLEPGAATPPAVIRVPSVREALAGCASHVRRTAKVERWIAITGSNGKTTTKELTAEGLTAAWRVHKTPGNYNNELGVPLTLLAMPEDTQAVVVELATRGPGEIADLTRLVDPDVGAITNIRTVHMETFQSLDDVAAAKGELFATMRDQALAVVNLDDVNVRVQATRHIGPRVTFGQHPAADLRLETLDNRFVPGAALTVSYRGQPLHVQLQIGGAHAAHDALTALALVEAAGADVPAAARRMERVEASAGRGRVHRLSRGIMLVDDTYNSSPPALASVLETLRLSEPAGRRVLISGDMLELGPMKAALHREAGRRAAAAGVQVLIAVGPLSREAAESARKKGVSQVHHYTDAASCAESIAEFLRDGDLIVVKGSRGMHMGQIVRALTAQLGEPR